VTAWRTTGACSPALIIQLHREVLQAERWELHRLREEIERHSALAA
jgi:hypothetical protein